MNGFRPHALNKIVRLGIVDIEHDDGGRHDTSQMFGYYIADITEIHVASQADREVVKYERFFSAGGDFV